MEPVDTEGKQVEWLTLREAAQRVDRSTKTLRRQVKAGELVGQRSGGGATAPWLVSSVSLADLYGDADLAEAAAEATTAATALSSGLSDVLGMLADANRAATTLAAEAGRYKAEAEHLRERLTETRALLHERAEARAREDDERRREDDERRRDAERRRWWRR